MEKMSLITQQPAVLDPDGWNWVKQHQGRRAGRTPTVYGPPTAGQVKQDKRSTFPRMGRKVECGVWDCECKKDILCYPHESIHKVATEGVWMTRWAGEHAKAVHGTTVSAQWRPFFQDSITLMCRPTAVPGWGISMWTPELRNSEWGREKDRAAGPSQHRQQTLIAKTQSS